MPPKVSITKDLILDAAFDIVREGGLEQLTARHIAKRLNCSTAPVYSSFQNMAQLEEEVMRKAADLLIEYTKRKYSDISFLNMGVGFVVFSRENKFLYRELFLKGDRFKGSLNDLNVKMYERLQNNPQFVSIPDEMKYRLLEKMWVFTHGLASLACAGLLDDDSDEFITGLLFEAGKAVISDTYDKAGLSGDKPVFPCPETQAESQAILRASPHGRTSTQ